MSQFLSDTLTKMSHKKFAYSHVLEYSKNFSYFEKKMHFLAAGGSTPPPPLSVRFR